MAEFTRETAVSSVPQIGSYRLVESLGSGGMSSVFRAIHVASGLEVALKVLPRSLAKNGTLLQRFLREAKSAESLQHPNIVAIYDRGSEDGRYYLVLEYVSGGDLHDRVRNKGPLSVVDAVGVIRAVATGLKHAAEQGLIHRDIKPANLLMTPEGDVKITDLGLALQIADEDERVTRDGTTVGTVDYMAPEQARDSRATSIRSDIYSLGCTFYYLLIGSAPFPGGDVPDKLRRHAFEAPPDVRALRPAIPRSLSNIIKKMMAKKPAKRYKDYDELLAALNAISAADLEPKSEVLDALIVDDEPDEESGLFALIDDEEEEDDEIALVSDDAPRGGKGPGGRDAPLLTDVNMAELAALDEDAAPSPRRQRRKPPSTAPVAPAAAPAPIARMSEEEVYDLKGARPAAVITRHSSADMSLRDSIMLGLMVGVAIVLVGFGLYQLVLWQTSPAEPTPTTSQAATEEENGMAPEWFETAPGPAAPAPRYVPTAPPPRSAPSEVPSIPF